MRSNLQAFLYLLVLTCFLPQVVLAEPTIIYYQFKFDDIKISEDAHFYGTIKVTANYKHEKIPIVLFQRTDAGGQRVVIKANKQTPLGIDPQTYHANSPLGFTLDADLKLWKGWGAAVEFPTFSATVSPSEMEKLSFDKWRKGSITKKSSNYNGNVEITVYYSYRRYDATDLPYWHDYYGHTILKHPAGKTSSGKKKYKFVMSSKHGRDRFWKDAEISRDASGTITANFGEHIGECTGKKYGAKHHEMIVWRCPDAKDPTSMVRWQHIRKSELGRRGPSISPDTYTLFNYAKEPRFVYRIVNEAEQSAGPKEELVTELCAQEKYIYKNARMGDTYVVRDVEGNFQGASWIDLYGKLTGTWAAGWAIGRVSAKKLDSQDKKSGECQEFMDCFIKSVLTQAPVGTPCDGVALCSAIQNTDDELIKSWVTTGGVCQKVFQFASGVNVKQMLLETLGCAATFSPAKQAIHNICSSNMTPEDIVTTIGKFYSCNIVGGLVKGISSIEVGDKEWDIIEKTFWGRSEAETDCEEFTRCEACVVESKRFPHENNREASCKWFWNGTIQLIGGHNKAGGYCSTVSIDGLPSSPSAGFGNPKVERYLLNKTKNECEKFEGNTVKAYKAVCRGRETPKPIEIGWPRQRN